jgi:hypothetical protein
MPGKSCFLTFCEHSPPDATTVVKADISNVRSLDPTINGIVCLAGHARVTFTDSTYNNNCAFSVLQAQDSSQLNIDNSSFIGSCAGESLEQDGCLHSDHHPGALGGAVSAVDAAYAAINVTNSLFQEGRACRGAGIAITGYTSLHMSSSIFRNNSAVLGAHVYVSSADIMTARNCTFEGVWNKHGIGALYIKATHSLVKDSVISVPSPGIAGIYKQGRPPLTLRNSTITNAVAPANFGTQMVGNGDFSAPDSPALTLFDDGFGKTKVYLQNTSINGKDICGTSSTMSSGSSILEQACISLDSSTALLCIPPNGATVSVHGAVHGYEDVCIHPKRLMYLVTAYSIFGAVMVLLLAFTSAAWFRKKKNPAGGMGSSSGLGCLGQWCGAAQECFDSPKAHHPKNIVRVILAGYDIVSDVVAMYIIRDTMVVGVFITALALPIFIASMVLHARVCHGFMQQRRTVPPSLWPYKMYSRCHPAVAGVFGWLCPLPMYQFLMHYPTMLMHAVRPCKWYTWLDLGHYASLYSFLIAVLQAPISMGIMSAATWSGTSNDLFPKMVTGSLFFLTIASSMASIVVWTSIVCKAALAGEVRKLFREMFWELVVPENGGAVAHDDAMMQLSTLNVSKSDGI